MLARDTIKELHRIHADMVNEDRPLKHIYQCLETVVIVGRTVMLANVCQTSAQRAVRTHIHSKGGMSVHACGHRAKLQLHFPTIRYGWLNDVSTFI